MAVPLAQHALQSNVQVSLSLPLKVALVALGAVVTAVSAQFTLPMPFTPVPFTFGPMAVLLTGATLGSRLGALSQVAYVMAGAFGLAVFAPSATLPNGFLRLAGPTGGYLLAYPLAAFVTGFLAERGWDRRYLSSVAAMLAGLAIIYVGGVSWLAAGYTQSIAAAVTAGIGSFIVLDVVRIFIVAVALPAAWRFVGRNAAPRG